MVVAVDPDRAALAGQGHDGVVRVRTDHGYGSGVLLPDGRSVLTAAHLFPNWPPASVDVDFLTAAGDQTIPGASVSRPSSYSPDGFELDLAVVRLAEPAPAMADRHQLYRDADELGQAFTLVGFGSQGQGATGDLAATGGERLAATNRFDAYGFEVEFSSAALAPGSRLLADFDSGASANDASPWLGAGVALGTAAEGLIAPGDSGGPALIDGEVAGIAGYTTRLVNTFGDSTDVDGLPNSSFGEVGGWARVSYFQQWIDQVVRDAYPEAPTTPEEVKFQLPEGAEGDNQLAYFLVTFHGVRDDPEQWLSVDYATRDGSAVAGQDYLPVAGTLNLYPGENQAVIPVEILGDDVPEQDERLYLDIFDPVGGSFPGGVETLTAARTIPDDDALIG